MGLPLFLVMAGAAAVEPDPIGPGAGFDLALLRPAPGLRIVGDRCRPDDPDEIVVCGRRDSRTYRWQPTANPSSAFARRRNPFERDLGGGRLGLRAATGTAMDGTPDKRVTINFKIPF